MKKPSKFNWDDFYDELEQGDPSRFPFWMFFFHEMISIIPNIISGLMVGLVLIIIVVSSMGIWTQFLEKHPQIIIKTFCESYAK